MSEVTITAEVVDFKSGPATARLVTVNIRKVPEPTRARMLLAAAARGMTLAEYLAALVQMHDAARAIADAGQCSPLAVELEALGLQTVSA